MRKYYDFNSKFSKLNNMIDIMEDNHMNRIKAALRKMEDFLVSKGIADTARDVKKMNRIEVKGIDLNGRERLIQNEIKEKFGIDMLEESEGYNTLLPMFSNGVIKCKTKELGTYYTQYEVNNRTEDEFDLLLREYRFYNGVFYLHYLISIEGISIKVPACENKMGYSGIKGFFLDGYSRNELRDFTDDELLAINDAASIHTENQNVDAITSYTLSTFRVINFLKEQYWQKNIAGYNYQLFCDNEYFTIKNWNQEIDTNDVIYRKQQFEYKQYLDELLQSRNCFKILENRTIAKIIQDVVKYANITTFYTAVGFAFRSGLSMIMSIFDNLRRNSADYEMIIGSLQRYDNKIANNKIDRKTVEYINELVKNKHMKLYTYKPAFYHGKFYYMSNSDKAFIIVGSSNISKTAFEENYEMDVIHIVDKGSEQDIQFLNWYYSFRKKCEKIEVLKKENFTEFNWTSELDAYQSLKNQRISIEEVKKKIEHLSDEDTKFRLGLWMVNNPTDIYDNVEIDALKDYTMFVFATNKLVVFESFVHGNAYYVFRYRRNLVDLISDISYMTKTQMACSVHYVSRGYHLQSKDKLVNRINRYFQLEK